MNSERGTRNAEWLNVGVCVVICGFVLCCGGPALAAPDAGALPADAGVAPAAPTRPTAATKAPPPAKKAPAGGYKPWTPPNKEQVSAPLFVVLAYSAIWLAVLAFVFSVWTRQRRVERELAQLIREQQE